MRCGDPTWIEGNWLLLCDGDGCERAWHTRCLPTPLEAVPDDDWLCPECELSREVKAARIDELGAAEVVKHIAWHSAAHASFELTDQAEAAARALREQVEALSQLAELTSKEIVEHCQGLCWNASRRAAHERAKQHEHAEKARIAFEKHSSALWGVVPASLAEGPTALASNVQTATARATLDLRPA